MSIIETLKSANIVPAQDANPDDEPSAEVVDRAKALFNSHGSASEQAAAPAPTPDDARIARLESLLETEHSLKEMYKQREMEAATKAGDLVKAAKKASRELEHANFIIHSREHKGVYADCPEGMCPHRWQVVDALDAALAKFEAKP